MPRSPRSKSKSAVLENVTPGALANPLIAAATILIIDDEGSNIRLLERILQLAQCRQLITVRDSREVLAEFKKHEPDLVLTDWMMPHLDGLGVIEQLRGSIGGDDYLPIVVLTADMTPDTKRQALAAGATDFLTKPFDQVEVLLRIGNLLQARAAHRKIQEQNAALESHVRERTLDLEKALGELRDTQRHVVQQERLAALGTMAGGIAHDFNNALSVIMGFSEILLTQAEHGLTKEAAAPPLHNILTAAEDASKIVGRLREFYRPDESDELHQPVNLNELLDQAVFLTKPRWETQSRATGKPIYIEAEFGEIGFVSGDAAALREALTNLIFNAVDAMPGGGTITLRTAASGKDVLVKISDTGNGMSDEVRERCLEPFFTTKGDKGTGLGLAMVFGIVQRHGGTMDLRSALGQGTTFALRFPTVENVGGAASASAVTLHRPLRILVVDDQPILCELLADYLEADMHSVQTAGDGHEALAKFRRGEFDLVITDHVMGEMNGEQLATEVKKLAPDVPVILLTGYAHDSSVEQELPQIEMVLGKPLSRVALRRALADVMASNAKPPAKLRAGR